MQGFALRKEWISQQKLFHFSLFIPQKDEKDSGGHISKYISKSLDWNQLISMELPQSVVLTVETMSQSISRSTET